MIPRDITHVSKGRWPENIIEIILIAFHKFLFKEVNSSFFFIVICEIVIPTVIIIILLLCSYIIQ